jgi:hypothetical protein
VDECSAAVTAEVYAAANMPVLPITSHLRHPAHKWCDPRSASPAYPTAAATTTTELSGATSLQLLCDGSADLHAGTHVAAFDGLVHLSSRHKPSAKHTNNLWQLGLCNQLLLSAV